MNFKMQLYLHEAELPSWSFLLMSERRRKDRLSLEQYSEPQKKFFFYFLKIILYKTLLFVHFELLLSCFVFLPEEVIIQDKVFT